MKQTPACEDFLLRWKGDILDVSLDLGTPRRGRAVLRTNIGGASIRRREIIEETEQGVTPLAKAWRDIPMDAASPGRFVCRVSLDEVGVFSGKACFFPNGSNVPEWPEGANFHVKVEPAATRCGNSIYTVFPRQFGSFREVVRRLDHIMDHMGFRIVQTLPPFPVPTTYAVMGEYGCPFAATDFFSVDPAMAEFDNRTTPLDQFRELIDAVHAKGGSLFVDLPANHTGWASALQTHHPEWFNRKADGTFVSPGAWGVTWEDLVELDYAHSGLRAYMADVFLFWCRQGVDGFRCDAGYMIPEATWTYIVARVREEFPDTVFMLEGLGGKLEVTDALLSRAGLDWAYSEIFQTYDRGQFEWYLPGAIARAERCGTLVHFAETHDNDRLAKGGETYARLRVALAALLSHQGAWGIANGVEWFAKEKIDVHGKNDLAWGSKSNMVDWIARLNKIVHTHPDFTRPVHIEMIQQGGGNFLAVKRGATLVIANLDCSQGITARWDAARYGTGEAKELLTGKVTMLSSEHTLAPGEILCFSRIPCADGRECRPVTRPPHPSNAVVWRWPQDAHREVCVPNGMSLAFDAPCAYRMRIFGDDGRTWPELPPYEGDGTKCRRLKLEFTAFTDKGVKRTVSDICIPPPGKKARVKLFYSSSDIRADDTLETVLSNGAGAAARVRLAWGEIRSQYDALFAANTNPNVPGDRLTLWTRCRAWLVHEGYSRELNKDCLSGFRADPAGRSATWFFRVPCGMGRETAFTFRLSLAEGANAAVLSVSRTDAGPREAGVPVRLVLRPDIEWRSFHSTTKAQGAVENAFGAHGAIRLCGTHGLAGAAASGFTFNPYGDAKPFEFRVNGGAFHQEPQWLYMQGHPEEAARGQEPCGDLYSPGWVSLDLSTGDSAEITAAYGSFKALNAPKAPKALKALNESKSLDVPEALSRALELFMVKRDDVKSVIAGYPWFLDWGRDTFIFLRGAIAAGYTREALDIVIAFARFEENGTLPNIIYGDTAGNRDTTDAQLWFIVAVRDLAAKLGRKILKTDCRGRTLSAVLESIVSHYVSGTPNGIRMDGQSGLVWSPSHFTWMDTNYPACTPRIGYPVEIQALWIAVLRFLGGKWSDLADRAAKSLAELFANGNGLADCLDAPNREPAAKARRDDAIRPNQLFALSLDAVADKDLARRILDATARLVVPGGIRSLDAAHPLYKGIYAGDEDTSRKPAYHNGTVWAWPFPMFAEGAVRNGLLTRQQALSLLASSVGNINSGCVCHVSEIADGDAPHIQKGCRAQAWSASELLRVWLALSGKGNA